MRYEQTGSESEAVIGDDELLVLCTDVKADVVYTNPAYQRVTGFTPEEIRAMPASARLSDMPPQVAVDGRETLLAGKPWSAVVKCGSKDLH